MKGNDHFDNTFCMKSIRKGFVHNLMCFPFISLILWQRSSVCVSPGSQRRRRTPSWPGYTMSFHTGTHWGRRRTEHTPPHRSRHHSHPRRCTRSFGRCSGRWRTWTRWEHRWCYLEAVEEESESALRTNSSVSKIHRTNLIWIQFTICLILER